MQEWRRMKKKGRKGVRSAVVLPMQEFFEQKVAKVTKGESETLDWPR